VTVVDGGVAGAVLIADVVSVDGAGVTTVVVEGVVVVAVVVSAGFTSTLVVGAGASVLEQPTTPRARRAATR
jgi:hypothetical protein